MSVDLSAQQEPTISVITTVPVAQNGGEMDALLLGRIGVSSSAIRKRIKHTSYLNKNKLTEKQNNPKKKYTTTRTSKYLFPFQLNQSKLTCNKVAKCVTLGQQQKHIY